MFAENAILVLQLKLVERDTKGIVDRTYPCISMCAYLRAHPISPCGTKTSPEADTTRNGSALLKAMLAGFQPTNRSWGFNESGNTTFNEDT